MSSIFHRRLQNSRFTVSRKNCHPNLRPITSVEDVSDALKAFDYHYAVEHAPGPYQSVVEPHAIVLDLGDVPNDTPVMLFLTGWIFPTDTSINVALFQNPEINPSFPSVCCEGRNRSMGNM